MRDVPRRAEALVPRLDGRPRWSHDARMKRILGWAGAVGLVALVVGSPARADAPTRTPIAVQARCVLTQDGLVAHFALRPTLIKGSISPRREAWAFTCERSTKRCVGAVVDLDAADRGTLRPNDLLWMDKASIASDTPSAVTVKWGLFRTFTLDATAERVTYAYSDGKEEERGETACPAPHALPAAPPLQLTPPSIGSTQL